MKKFITVVIITMCVVMGLSAANWEAEIFFKDKYGVESKIKTIQYRENKEENEIFHFKQSGDYAIRILHKDNEVARIVFAFQAEREIYRLTKFETTFPGIIGHTGKVEPNDAIVPLSKTVNIALWVITSTNDGSGMAWMMPEHPLPEGKTQPREGKVNSKAKTI